MRQVIYCGKKYDVLHEEVSQIDGPMLKLQRAGTSVIWAPAGECREPKPQKRRMKDGRHVLEMSGGSFTVRRARSPKRYPFTLADLYDWAVRCSVMKGSRLPKAFRARRKR